jgi:hypothetical protein
MKSFEGSISSPASDQALVDFQANLEGKYEVMDLNSHNWKLKTSFT